MTNLMNVIRFVLTVITVASLAASVNILANRPEAYTLVYYFGDLFSVAVTAWIWLVDIDPAPAS